MTEGHLNAQGCHFAIVVSKFNHTITDRLLSEALLTLRESGIQDQDIEVVRVPGAFEIPMVASCLAKSKRFDSVVCLGAIIRGDTPHFDYISAETSRGIGQASVDSGIPVIFGVLTTNTVEEAMNRSEPGEFNRGADAAKSAMEMATLMKSLHRGNHKSTGFRGSLETDSLAT
jgi:6,7-dimethyl-8-ribityllumazine synthase